MRKQSLHFSIFKLTCIILLMSSLAILLTVWLTTSKQTTEQSIQDLEIAQNVLNQVIESKNEQLFITADVLTSDFGFKEAIASWDTQTIKSALINHQNRISSDLILMLSLSGEVLTSTNEFNPSVDTFTEELLDDIIEDGGWATFLMLDNKIYQAILLPINAPNPIAVTVIGFEIDYNFVQELKKITKLDISITTENARSETTSISTLSQIELRTLSENDKEIPNNQAYLINSDQHNDLMLLRYAYDNSEGQQVLITLSQNYSQKISAFQRLLVEISLIAVFSIIVSLIWAAFFASRITKPLTKFIEVSQKISLGQYNTKISPKGKSLEIHQLADAFSEMQKNIQSREEQIAYQATHDHVTNLYNLYQISSLLQEKLALVDNFQVLGLEINRFKEINDTFGYHIGDECLKVLSERLSMFPGKAARMNGAKIFWLPDSSKSPDEILTLRKSLEEDYHIDGLEIGIKIRIGLLDYNNSDSDPDTMIRNLGITINAADESVDLYAQYDRDLEIEYMKRLEILHEMENTIDYAQHELTLHYQPKLDLETGEINKLEALLRWNNKKLGYVGPDIFITIAESAGIIMRITLWVIQQAVKDILQWKQVGRNYQVAINLSSRDVINQDLLPFIISLLDTHNLSHDVLSFEITESAIMSDREHAISQLIAYREAGFSLSIDDFGTGYSSLAYIKDLPVNEIKIDKSFIMQLNVHQSDRRIVQTIIKLSQDFGIPIVAEGVENQESLELLKSWGCNFIQGYHIAKPMPVSDINYWMDNQ